VTERVEIAQRRRRTHKRSDATLSQELRDSLVVITNGSLYFSYFMTCIMPRQKSDTESEQEDDEADSEASATRLRAPQMKLKRVIVGLVFTHLVSAV
jgi:hypothetical protein